MRCERSGRQTHQAPISRFAIQYALAEFHCAMLYKIESQPASCDSHLNPRISEANSLIKQSSNIEI